MSSPDSAQTAIQQEILQEAGTNELEILVFYMAGHPYGVNVAKVREVMLCPKLTRPPTQFPAVEGVFMFRGRVVPVLRLRDCLGLPPYAPEALVDPQATRVIVTEFSQRLTAFRVDTVERIVRVYWDKIMPVPRQEAFSECLATAILNLDERLVPLPDLERLIAGLGGSRDMEAPITARPQRADFGIALAEDSHPIQRILVSTLQKAGYTRLRAHDDGEQMWQWLQQEAMSSTDSLRGRVDLIITDIEMPNLDGLRLTRLVREHPRLKALPVVIFSSLITPETQHKGDSVGATAQICKPQLPRLVELIDSLLLGTELGPEVPSAAALLRAP